MKNKNIFTIAILAVTIILGIVAIFTAFKLYQIGKPSEEPTILQQEPVAPTAPELTTKHPYPLCYENCVSDADCNASPTTSVCGRLICGCPPGEACTYKLCYNPRCPFEKDCICMAPSEECTLNFDIGIPTPTPTPTGTMTPTPTPTGTMTPTPTPTGTMTPTPTPTGTGQNTTTPTPVTQLPEAGSNLVSSGTIVGIFVILIAGLLLLAI